VAGFNHLLALAQAVQLVAEVRQSAHIGSQAEQELFSNQNMTSHSVHPTAESQTLHPVTQALQELSVSLKKSAEQAVHSVAEVQTSQFA
jgi:hypothetical protein